MGFDSRIYIGYALKHPDRRDTDGRARLYPDITIEMPRLGWDWARTAREDLRSGDLTYRVMDPAAASAGYDDGYTEDAYGVPLTALDPKAVIRYLRTEHPETLDLPSVAALIAALQQVKRRSWREHGQVVVFYGH